MSFVTHYPAQAKGWKLTDLLGEHPCLLFRAHAATPKAHVHVK
jgi:hypothetical protein